MNATIGNSLSEIPRVAAMVETLGAEYDLPSEVVFDIQLALEEILTNAISYGCADGGPHRISVRLTAGGDAVVAEVEDDGSPFNPLQAPPPDVTSGLRERVPGGLGIHFVRTLMDDVEYSREGSFNRLTLRRRLSRR